MVSFNENIALVYVSEIGKGLNGTVYKVISEDLNEYALKLFKESNKLVEKERYFYSRLKTKANIIRCYENLSSENCLVFEVAETLSTEFLIARERAYRYKYLLDVAIGISECEEEGIIHGDIKESNILLSQDEKTKLSDFSSAYFISKIENANINLNHSDLKLEGTPAYLPPEILNLRYEILNSRREEIFNKTQDIYAWGIIAYRLFNKGKLPFEGNGLSAKDAVQERQNGKRAKKPEIMPLVLWKIVEQTILPDHEQRKIRAEELVFGMKRVIEEYCE